MQSANVYNMYTYIVFLVGGTNAGPRTMRFGQVWRVDMACRKLSQRGTRFDPVCVCVSSEANPDQKDTVI